MPPQRPTDCFEPRPFASQTKVSFEAPSTVVYDKKFDTAIRASHVEQHYSRVKMKRKTLDDQLTTELENYPERMVNHDISSAAHARIMRDLFEKYQTNDVPKFRNPAVTKRTHRMIDLALANLELQTKHLNGKNHLPMKANVLSGLKQIAVRETMDHGYLNVLFDYADWLLGVINMSNAMYADYYRRLTPEEYVQDLRTRNRATYKMLGLTISWGHNFCVVSHSGRHVLLPKSYILLLHNKTSDLISILLYSKIAKYSSMPPDFEVKVVDTCINLWQTVIEYGQQGFTICKCLEALASAETLCITEKWDNRAFLEVVCRDLRDDTGFDYKTSELRQIWRGLGPAALHELACLSKIAGHPLVDMEGGAQTIHKYTTEQYILDYDKINECTCYVKQNYIRNYILRYGKWPSHTVISSAAPDAIKYGSLLNLDPEGFMIKSKHGNISVLDYNFVELEADQKFNKLENVIPHLKDKTISALRSNVIKKYITHQDVKTGWADTRLLLYYLLHDNAETDHTEFLARYSEGELMDDFINYLVIRIVPKEKEMKIKFRGFGCTTFPNRMLFLAQEKTAMEYLDLFCDEQAMTLSELDLVKRLHAFRCLKDAYPLHEVLYIMVDASKWNNHFRRETTDKVLASTLDRIYDTKVFGRTHEKYQKTLFYVPDGDVTYFWEGQDGGVEGLNQDSWVVVYIGQIKTALSGYDLKYHVLCKGDDLRIAVLIPHRDVRAQDMAETKNQLMVRISKVAADMGHDIKILDSYGSTRYFNFSKTASIDKIELTQVLRKIQKCYGATNAFLPTIDDFIGSTFSNAHSACRVTTNVIPCFFVALAWAYYYLLSDELSLAERAAKKKKMSRQSAFKYSFDVMTYAELSDVELIALLLVPSSCGGFPIIHLHNMIARAESDMFPAFLDLITYVKSAGKNELYQTLTNFLVFDSRRKTTWKPLYMDMYAMPILKPNTPSFILRQSIIDPLKSMTRSSELMQLFDLLDDESGSASIIKCLDSCETIPAKVFSVIYAALPESILGEIIRKFETARSVMELLILRRGVRYSVRIIRKVLQADVEVNMWRLNRLQGNHSGFAVSGLRLLDICPAESAYIMRETFWGKPIEGITMPPMSHLIGFCTSAQGVESMHVRTNHFTLRVDRPTDFLEGAQGNYHFGVGHKRPFLGHRTGTGTVNPLLHLVEKDKFLSNLRNLAELASWVQISGIDDQGQEIDSNIYLVIERIVTLYTSVGLQTFAPFLGSRKSGTVAHHIRTRHFRESIVPNSVSNIYQYVEGESNTHSKFFGDHGHYWINFLQILCHGVSLATFELNVLPFFTTPNVVWIYTENCDFCMRQVQEDPIVVDVGIIKNVKFPQLEMLQMGNEALSVLKESLSIAKTRKYNVEGNSLELTIEQATQGTLKMVVEMSVDAAARLTDRFTQHPGSKSGAQVLKAFAPRTKRRVIGQRELSCMENDTLCKVVPYIIVQLMMKHLSRRALSDIPDSLHTIPPGHLPWFELLHELSRVGRLYHLSVGIAEIADKYPSYLTFKPEQVAAYLGNVSLEAIGRMFEVPDLVLLSDYEITEIHKHLSEHLFIVSWARYIGRLATDEDREAVLESVIYAIIRDYIIDNVPLHTDDDDDLVSTGEYAIAQLYHADEVHAALEALGQTDDIHEWRKLLSYRHILYLRHANITEQEIFDLYCMDSETYHAEWESWVEETTISVVCTTAWACLSTLRESGMSFRDAHANQQEYVEPSYDLAREWRPAHYILRYGSDIPAPTENPLVSSAVLVQPVVRENDCLVGSHHLYRPYGAHNASSNHLILIFSALGISDRLNLSNRSVSCLGDGIGNGTLFFAQFGRNMRIIFTTKPDNQMLHITPDVAMDQIRLRGHVLYTKHIQEGIWDLREGHTFESLEDLYGRHDLYFCDAEPNPGDPDIDEVYYNVVNHFVRSKKDASVLIMQVKASNSPVVGKCASFLAFHCAKVHIIQPPSISRITMHYLVAYGKRRTDPYDDSRLINITPRVAQVLRDHYTRRAQERSEERYTGTSKLSLRPAIVRCPRYRTSLPPLWVSMMNKDLGVAVDATAVSTMISSSSGLNEPWELNHLNRLFTTHRQIYLRRSLDDPTELSGQVLSRPVFSLEYHANRLVRLHRLWSHVGFNWALTLFTRGHTDISEDDIKAAFRAYYNSLNYRDRVLDETRNDFYLYISHTTNGVPVRFWACFINGIQIVQEIAAWLHAIQQVQGQHGLGG
ncbi:RNA-directed RNA polymerase [Mos8Chu0 chuvirus]|uniref:RNA-directed RNA polymerase n=1 Tax=Mos8Chu0 chuvirus TaxID=2847850 RepID=A0A1L4A1T3_9VIRU|nr:RNA-directed RNA polymerase [Mos8Chu0 chuvirus]API61887.1 RNA-directed RNA polymerase [Mos8Chu0 chuvirus]